MAVLLERGNLLSLETCVNAEDLPKIACLFSRNFCIRVNMLHKLKSILLKIQIEEHLKLVMLTSARFIVLLLSYVDRRCGFAVITQFSVFGPREHTGRTE